MAWGNHYAYAEVIMSGLVRAEVWKAFHNKNFSISLAVGLGIQSLNVIYNIFYVQDGLLYSATGADVAQTRSLFIRWISADGWTLGFNMLWFLFPLLAAFPFGASLFYERKTGYINLILCKVTRIRYYTAKYIAVFLAGGTVISVTLLVNLLLNALVCPAALQDSYNYVTPVLYEEMGSALFYTNPWLFSFMWIGIDFLWGGVLAGICMLTSLLFSKRIFVLAVPFAVVRLLDVVLNYNLSPSQYFMISTYITHQAMPMFGMIGLCFIIGFGGGWVIFRKMELV